MAKVETDARAVRKRLVKDGWVSEGGAKHEKFANPAKPGLKIMVPLHRRLTPGVARSIGKAAGWPGEEESENAPLHRPD